MSLEATHLHSQLWVVAVLNNPMRYKRRVELFHQFIARMKVTGVNLCVVELAYGCLLYTSPSPRDRQKSRMPSSA